MVIRSINDIPIASKGLMLLLFPFIIQIGLLLILSDQVRRTGENQELATHSQEVLLSISRAGQKALEANAAVRSFLLFSNPSLVKNYEENKEAAREEISNLFVITSDSPLAFSFINQIKTATETLLESLDQTVRLLERNDTKSAFEEASKLEQKELRAKVVTALENFSNHERELSNKRKIELEGRRKTIELLVVIGFVLCALATLTANSVFSKNVSQRLRNLTERLESFRNGHELGPPSEASDEIGEVDRALSSLTRTLGARDREIELFIYSVSHDLRSPLINLEGFSAELARTSDKLRELCLAENSSSMSPDKIELKMILEGNLPRAIKFIRSAVERLSGIINALLYLSRVGRVPFSWTRVSLEPLLERIVNALQTSIAEKKVEITVEKLPEVVGDATALEQIFGNLLSNAVQYSDPSRPGKISVYTANSSQLPAPGFVTIAVKDNGLGIPDTAIEKLFVGFQRFHPELGKGEGIGLAAVRRLVERHGGKIRVKSTIGVGTVFYIDLPITVQERVSFDTGRTFTGVLNTE